MECSVAKQKLSYHLHIFFENELSLVRAGEGKSTLLYFSEGFFQSSSENGLSQVNFCVLRLTIWFLMK